MFMWHDTQWMWLGMLLFWVLVAVIVFYLVKDRGRSAADPPRRDATDLLDERYARGEISGEEYSERRETLQHTVSS